MPEAWAARAYPSLKPLSSWVADLCERLAFIAGWVARGAPPVFWISGFFFPQVLHCWLHCDAHACNTGIVGSPRCCCMLDYLAACTYAQAFLTGTLQNYARKHGLPIDTVSFGFSVADELGPAASIRQGPPDGCFIRGLMLEGARWDADQHQLGELLPLTGSALD